MSDDFTTPPNPNGSSLPQDPTQGIDPDATITQQSGDAVIGERPGTTIGRYKLIRTLGEGGFGTVFLAEQLEPVKREVALKVIKLGMDTKQVIARFEAERQALAMMDHPGIAKVFDAGTTDSGRPYFVMELVKGETITAHCDRLNMPTKDRLALFNQVCEAVQHAHQKGIIHRDIKPSNVLVADGDGKAQPKVIDFGIAKATNQRLTEKTVFTQMAQFIGTPAYMSPEQAEVSEVDIDTRSDIYSLGVLLYELLAGATPFDSSQLLSAGYGEIQRIIKEVEPPLPSSRVSSLGDSLKATAEHRQLNGNQLAKRLKGELDWIVMKCLEKDRTRRYETANGLARDVGRFLVNEPVSASPPSRSYRLKKLIVRNRAVFVAGFAMVALLAAGVVGTGVGLVRAKRAEKQAITAAATSNQVATFLTDMLSGVGPSAARGRDTEMLEEILLETHEKLAEDLAGQPEAEGEIRSYLGTTYFDLGQYTNALEQYQLSLKLLTTAFGESHEDVAQQYGNLGLTHEQQQNFELAETNLRKALALRLDLFGEMNAAVGESKLYLANYLVNDGRYEDAEPLLLEALEVQRQTLGQEDEQMAISLNSLGNLMQHLERYEEAGPYYDQALAMHTKLLGADHPFVITDGLNLGWLSYNLGDFKTANRYFSDAEIIGRRVYGEKHPKVVEILTSRGDCEEKLGNMEAAESLYREAWDMSAATHGPGHILTSEAIDRLVDLMKDLERRDEAIALMDQVLTIQKSELGELHPTTVITQGDLGYAVYKNGDIDTAIPLLWEAREAYVIAFGLEHKNTAQAVNNLGRALRDHGDLEEAVVVLTEAVDIRKSVLGPDHLHVQVVNFDLAQTRRGLGQLAEADRLMEEVLDGYYASLDSTHWVIGQALGEWAELKMELNRPEDALDTVSRGRQNLVGAYGGDSPKVLPIDAVFVLALGRSGDLAGANTHLAMIVPRLGNLDGRKRALAQVYIGRYEMLAGRYEEAGATLNSAHDSLLDMHGKDHFETIRATDALEELYKKWPAGRRN